MCGIFGVIAQKAINTNDLKLLVKHSKQRGRDSSGLIFFENKRYCEDLRL